MIWFWILLIIYWIGVYLTYKISIEMIEDPKYDLKNISTFKKALICFISSMFVFPITATIMILLFIILLVIIISIIPLFLIHTILFKVFGIHSNDVVKVLEVTEKDLDNFKKNISENSKNEDINNDN